MSNDTQGEIRRAVDGYLELRFSGPAPHLDDYCNALPPAIRDAVRDHVLAILSIAHRLPQALGNREERADDPDEPGNGPGRG